ncbi:hypothetical protein [Metabacillus idriensis]|uniref:hypothetical protein n=1 Tax=Metabacillus idriensis TaxID=324768 RepID=UPI00174EA1B3|nr:hypothetical protein [Metabacillus idriensis]
MLNNQNGYALLNVLLIFTILTIAGISLLGITISSQNYVAYSQTYIEEMADAEMELDEATELLVVKIEELNTLIGNGQINQSLLLNQINQIINTLNMESDYDNFEPYKNIPVKEFNTNSNLFLQKIEVSIPIGNNHVTNKYLKKVLTVSTIADVFKYSAVTEGKLILNGASEITGDIYANQGVYLSNYGKFSLNYWNGDVDNFRPLTTYPSINGNLTVKGNNQGPKFYYGKQPNWIAINDSSWQSYFVKSPTLKDRDVDFNQFDINSLVDNKLSEYNSVKNTFFHYSYNENLYSNLNLSRSVIFYENLDLHSTLTVTGDVFLNKGINIKENGKLIVKGNVYSLGNNNLSGEISLTNSTNYLLMTKNTTISNLTLNGTMFNKGNVTIKNNLNTNGTIYVSGESKIENLNNESGGTAVLLSEGNITLSNNNQYQETAREIDAFLYSNKDLEIYGVGSNIKINGGIYGRNITLNATRGSTYPISGWKGYTSNLDISRFDSIGFLYIQKNQTNSNLKSRLQIEFDPSLIQNPPTGIPTVEKLQITEIDQKIE